ncbi:MAG: single-stranded DNA-binding protein [Kiritimatiellae bacterium]|nr:single-stranded DNA-binding protein [Kiritimatiellia bacterium]MDD5522137.1 single-stranded DNA-binding protein [Kiritimatiellia bacterium]
MASLNKVFLIGNLTKDPEIRYTPSGKAVGDLRMAINRKFKTADGQDRDETCFVAVVVWGRQAETCGEYLHKGSPVMVEGRLRYEEWEKDGKKNNRLRVVAERVQFMGGPKSGGSRDTHGSEPAKKGEDAGGPEEVVADSGPVDEDNLPF